jgi:8-oxo-dGTP pyrophosphatase MutT (NUDIX family)
LTVAVRFTSSIREWTVGGALIRHGTGLVMVANRRRDGSIDWTPPGGVIDEGETVQQGLVREVFEETGLVVRDFHGLAYRVEVSAPELGWRMQVEAWEVAADGDIEIADPDGIVEHVRRMERDEATTHLLGGAPWVHVPVGEWLDGICGAAVADTVHYRFRVDGADRSTSTAVRLP